MEESFKMFRSHLDKDVKEEASVNPFRALKSEYEENKITFYDYLDKM